MNKSKHLIRILWILILGTICFLGLPLSTLGQFSMVSTIPADGAASVDTAVTFQITFSAPLDTSVRFDYPPEFFLSVIVHPDSLTSEPDSITLSPDLTTVYVHNLHLWPDTKYLFLIANAVSITNDSLAIPYLVTFTTGSSLPTATVSGTVSFPGADVTGTAVILFNAPLFTEEEVEAENATIVQTSAGNYTINYVSPGTYWPVAVKDFSITAYGELEPNVGGGMGFYDADANGVPDSIVISEGQQVSGIDISLFSLAPVTARHNYPTVVDSAQSWASDAALVQLGTQDISPSGEALIWMYAFYSPTLAAYHGWVTMGTLVMPMEMEEPPEDTTALPANWLDSDVVADSAEAHGGSDFRAQFPDASAMAFLGTMEFPGSEFSSEKPQKTSKSLLSHRPGTGFLLKSFPRHEGKPSFSLQKNLSFQNSRAVWGFFYFSEAEGQQLFLLFDAVTGEPIQPPQPAATTARVNLDAANQAAQTWASDAELILVGTHQSNLNPAGEAEMWFFMYYSAIQHSEQAIFLSNGIVLGQGPTGWEPPSKVALPLNWIDSDVAIDTAEVHGGSQYRASNQNVWVNGGVSRGLLPGQPERPVWYFDYNSSTAGQLTIYVDAVTGEFISGPPPMNITARYRLQDVNQEAQAWASDAVLTFIGVVQPLAPDGTCFAWAYAYYSPSKDSIRVFYAAAMGPISSETPTILPPSKEALPDKWIDSDVATATAEVHSGNQFRTDYPDAIVIALLSRNVVPGEPSQAAWKFTYWSTSASKLLELLVDALTGGIITGVDSRPQETGIPQSYALSQNHPNPFNPETVIEYQLPRASEVEISIFNLQGKKVTTLVKDYQTAGFHKTIWNGRDESGQPVASGVYLYQLKAGNFVAVKKMLLLR